MSLPDEKDDLQVLGASLKLTHHHIVEVIEHIAQL